MKQVSKLFFVLLFISYSVSALAQRPIINSISESKASVNEIIVISGAGFGTSASSLKVFFGAVAGEIVKVTENLIEVKVPAGATHHSISVTRTDLGLTAYAEKQFDLSYRGEGFDEANFAAQQNFPATNGLFDLCLCDFDGDFRPDVATANGASTDVGLYKNTSLGNSISFASRQSVILNPAAPTRNISCGDIDGDGKPDLVVSGDGSHGDKVFVFRNTSPGTGTINFAAPALLTLGKNGAARIAIRDLDLDGKPELVVTNRSENKISIFPNTSEIGTIAFAAGQTITVEGAIHSNGLAVEDLDADGLPEIIFNTLQSKNVYILKNKSTSSSFSFAEPVVLETPEGIVNMAVGDLDKDGKADIAVTGVVTSQVIVFKNQSLTHIAFSAANNFSTDPNPWGITLGDVDGNDAPDIIVAFHTTNNLNVLLNQSTTGAMSFSKTTITTSENTRNVKFGDLNGDAKPDFVFTSTETPLLSVRRNKTCIVPEITPEGPLNICSDTPLKLFATKGMVPGVTYQWKVDDVEIPGETNFYIAPADEGVFTVTVTSTADGCANTSEGVEVIRNAGVLGTVQLDDIAPVCVGETLTLTAQPVAGATYYWTGPNGFSEETQTNELTIENATIENAGAYVVVINNGTCSSQPLTANAVVYALPKATITAQGPTDFCEGGFVTLSTGTNFAAYQWLMDGEAIAGAITPSYIAEAPGNYSVKVTNATGCVSQSEAIQVNEFSPPEAAFIAPQKKCIGEAIAFQNTSVTEGENVSYLWDFGDGNTSTEENPSHAYTEVSTYDVKLTVSYNTDCKNEITKTIEITEAPVINIIPEGATEFCEGDSVKLSVPEGFATYLWSNGSRTASTYAKKDGTMEVTVITNEGCSVSATIEVNVLPFPEVTISADKTTLSPGESVQLVASGAFTYAWEPADGLTDLTSNSPIVSPDRTTQYIVTGTNSIGCTDTDTITIVVNNEFDVTAPKLFAPASGNGTWDIEQMEFFPGCTVTIFNKQGLKLFEQKDYANNPWNGTYKGSPVPEGVYYFIIRCEGEENMKTGSITLMR